MVPIVDRLLKARRKTKKSQSGRWFEQIQKGRYFWESLLTINISCVAMGDTPAAGAGAGDSGRSGLVVWEYGW